MSFQAGPFEVVYSTEQAGSPGSLVTVTITCYKYGGLCLEALDSLLTQTEPIFDLCIVDDRSPDDSLEVIGDWCARNAGVGRFGKVALLRHCINEGLSRARNSAISWVTTPYTFILDADNLLYPRALEALREGIEHSGCAMAYSLVEVFGGKRDIIGNSVWLPERFETGNYIDAMAMVRTETLRDLGGYRVMPSRFGWEDYDFWCKMVDRGLRGCHVPEILCRYRSHPQSMVNTGTRDFLSARLAEAKADLEKHHKMKFRF